MTRSTQEWIGKNDDSVPPDSVKLRIWRRQTTVEDGVEVTRCHITGLPINPGDPRQLDHIIAIIDNGPNRESNMAYALGDPHKKKTRAEVKRRAKNDARAKAHIGIKKQGRTKIQSAGFRPAPARLRPKSKKIMARAPIYVPKG